MNAEVFKDTRLLEALELIDDKYIADAARYNMDYVPRANEVPVRTWKTPFKYWKQFTALAACMVLFAFSAPIFSYFSKVIGNWGAAAGNGTSEQLESLESTETEEILYLQFTPELEHISKELIEEVKDAHCVYWRGCTRAEYIEKKVQEKGEDYRSYITDYLELIGPFQQIYHRLYSPYYGTFNDCLVLACIPPLGSGERKIEIAGYQWRYNDLAEVYAYSLTNKELCKIEEAYERGWLRDKDIAAIAERHAIYEQYYKERRNNYYE